MINNTHNVRIKNAVNNIKPDYNNSVLVTIADKKYVNAAKQLFSSAYWNAGWKGEYLLLAHEIPEKELKWFKNKGIKIYKCKSLWKEKRYGTFHASVLDKTYLFKPYFKKWKTVVYIDADAIIKASLEPLTGLEGFHAAIDDNMNLGNNLCGGRNYTIAERNYNLKSQNFNSGVLVIETKSIKKDAFQKLQLLKKEYSDISILGEQLIFNLYFYNKWKKLLRPNNILINTVKRSYNIEEKNMKAIVLHFANRPKPWKKGNVFYNEWNRNLKLAEKINLNIRRNPAKIWSKKEQILYHVYLKILLTITRMRGPKSIQMHNRVGKSKVRKIKEVIARILYRIGRIIKKISPKLYYKLGGKN